MCMLWPFTWALMGIERQLKVSEKPGAAQADPISLLFGATLDAQDGVRASKWGGGAFGNEMAVRVD